MGESLINLSLTSNVNLQGQHSYINRTTLRQGIKALVFIGLIRIDQSQDSCCMITVFTTAKYEIEIECLASTLINAFSKHGQSFQYDMQNVSGKQINQSNRENKAKSERNVCDKAASTYLDTSENASEQMAGQGTSLMAMCPRAAG